MSTSTDTTSDLHRAFECQIGLCDALEALADQLPQVDRQRCITLAGMIGPVLGEAQAIERRLLFPQLAATQPGGRELVENLNRDQLEDACLADELRDQLLLLGSGQQGLAPDAMGYMLRAFFECIRRRVRHERALLAQCPG